MSDQRGLVPLRRTGRDDGVTRRADVLLNEAFASDDAESQGLLADELLADHRRAEKLLCGPDAWGRARHAVVQRYGRVGAMLIVGYEERKAAREQGHSYRNLAELDQLVERFYELDAPGVEALLAAIDRVEGLDADDEDLASRRRLHAAYAVAERDGTQRAHRAYMSALDRVMRRAGAVLAS